MMHKSVFRLSILCIIFVFFSLSVSAATIIVTNTNDSGVGSLRQAVIDAASGDTINFAVTGTITLTSGEILINKNLNIISPSAASLTIDGNATSRIFVVESPRIVNIHGITFQNGYSPTNGGAIYNVGILTVTNCIFSGNSVTEAGGAIYNNSSSNLVSIIDTTFLGNSANNGGAVLTYGPLFVSGSTFSGNSVFGAGSGGVIFSSGNVDVINSTFSGNSSVSSAGAIFNRAGDTLNLTNNTFSGNSANRGGAIFNFGIINATNNIISGNTATILGTDCFLSGGTFNANANNVFGTNGSNGGCTNGASDIVPAGAIGTILAPLANNGGPTQTHALVAGSPAIDAANNANCPASDQRGTARVGNCDIGAFELAGTIPTVVVGTVSSTNILENGGTATINVAVANLAPGDSLTVIAHISGGTATLTSDYTITPSLTFNTNGNQSFTITGVADVLPEGNETLTVNFTLQGAGTISGNGNQTVTITDVLPPTFSKIFAPDVMAVNAISTLTFTIDNTANTIPSSTLDFTDNLPAGAIVATPANASTTCIGGTLTAVNASGVISYTGGTVAASSTCTVSVDVTASAAGSYVNISGDLTSSLGNSGTATDTLTIVPASGFSKAFAPDTIAADAISTLTFTIDNTGSTLDATSLDFTDNLPAGIIVATPANASTTCTGGTLTAVDASGVISYTGGTVTAGSTCTVTVDVTASAAGSYVNLTGDLTSSLGNSGTATDTLIVAPTSNFSKVFSPNPIALGGAISTLTFTIDNTGSTLDATSLDFTDNLPAGMIVATPANASTTCTGGTLTAVDASGVISYTGGTLAAGGTCIISVDVTAIAAGSYVNLTGDLTSSLGNSGTATDTLEVIDTLGIGKSFTDDPVEPGDVVTLEFTVTNGDLINDATDITFTDDLDAMLLGTVAIGLPMLDVCGVGSEIAGTSLITLTGGNLLAGTSCTFSLTLQLDAGVADGNYINTTSTVEGTILGLPVIENAATDTLVVATIPLPAIGVFDPAISKIGLLVPGQVGVIGEQLEWIITVSNNGGIAGQNVTVTDIIDSRLSINSVNAPGATVQVNGQAVSVTYPTINSGQTVKYSIFTTVIAGESVTNTVCIAGTSVCATGLSVGELPQTGESQRP